MKDILNIAKLLSDVELERVIRSLNSLLDKRKAKALNAEKERAENAKRLEEVRDKINAIVAEKGLSLEMLGLISTSNQSEAKTTLRKRKLQVENQFFALNEAGQLQLIFTRILKEHKSKGTALRFSDLTKKQQLLAASLVAEKNG